MDIRIANTKQGIQALFKTAKPKKINLSNPLYCLEHPGIYTHRVAAPLAAKNSQLTMVNRLKINRSLGLQGGKNDDVAARRLAEYAARFQDKCRPHKPLRPVLEDLKKLLALRRRLVNQTKMLSVPLAEAKGRRRKNAYPIIKASTEAVLKQATLEKKLLTLIKAEEQLFELYTIAASVPGLGKITGMMLLICTQEFERTPSAKKCACDAGVVPFERTAGKRLRGRSRVSSYANKELKSLMPMGALSVAVRRKGDLKAYNTRKVEKEPKHKMVVLNAKKNKLQHIVYACVRARRLYEAARKCRQAG